MIRNSQKVYLTLKKNYNIMSLHTAIAFFYFLFLRYVCVCITTCNISFPSLFCFEKKMKRRSDNKSEQEHIYTFLIVYNNYLLNVYSYVLCFLFFASFCFIRFFTFLFFLFLCWVFFSRLILILNTRWYVYDRWSFELERDSDHGFASILAHTQK